MKRLIRSMASTRGGLALLGGMTMVLVGMERLLTTRTVVAPLPQTPRRGPDAHCFRISQTRSDLGYVYWVAQGFGCYRSFALFDTWAEAMEHVNSVLRQHAREASEPVHSYA